MRIAHNNFVESGEAEILIVYQKEPHPGQMAFENIAQPETLEQRCALARRMKDEYELPMTVLVDSMEDQSRALFSDLPSPAFVIDKEGIVRAKFPWAEGEQIEAAVGVVTGRLQVSRQTETSFTNPPQVPGGAADVGVNCATFEIEKRNQDSEKKGGSGQPGTHMAHAP
ncbi:MAG: hypothetical protein AAF456_25135, partial [Planctomycetota bacterium]